MMWLNGEVLQVYWNGVHHVAAYLGNILVWRENIRAAKAVQDIEVTTPLATGTLRLSIPAKSYQHLQLLIDKATANAGDSKSPAGSTDAGFRVSGDAYTRAARFPQGDTHFSISIDLATVISALAREALGVVAEGPEIVSDAASALSVATTLSATESVVSENNVASSRPVQPSIGSCNSVVGFRKCVGAASPGQLGTGSVLILAHPKDFGQIISQVPTIAATEKMCSVKCIASAVAQCLRFRQVGDTVYIYRPMRWRQEGDTVYLDYTEAAWEAPEEDGDALIVRQVYSAAENNDYLEVT